MQISPELIKDLAAATDLAARDVSPAFLTAAADWLHVIADRIKEAASAQAQSQPPSSTH